MKTYFPLPFLLLWLILPVSLIAQEFEIRGTVVDSAAKALPGITASLQDTANEGIAVGAISDQQGKFAIKLSKAGTYKLLVYSPGYLSFVDTLAFTFKKNGYDLGNIQLSVREFTADSVMIQAETPPMLILGDTVVYNVNAYQTRPNAVLEKLLEQLPGIEVNEDGSVTAEGQPVQQIKIDGKEFFGNNVQMAVKNIPVDAVAKVQVMDGKTEESEFTGVNDGVQLKTINIQLKPEKRGGYFGNIGGGYGIPDDRYVGKMNAFRFSNKIQLSVIGLVNNVNQVGFGGDQISQFMGGWENMGSTSWSGNGVSIGGVGVGLPVRWGDNDGFINTQAGGINMNYQLDKRTQLTTTYVYGGSKTTLKEEKFRENFLPDNSFTTEDEELRLRRNDGHAFNLMLKQEIDTTQQLQIQAAASIADNKLTETSDNKSFNSNGDLQNSSLRNISETDNQHTLGASLRYRKRFKKKGRNFYIGTQGSLGNEDRDKNIFADNQFWIEEEESFDIEQLIQDQLFTEEKWNYSIYSGFNEPIGEEDYLTFGYNRSENADNHRRETFDLEEGNEENGVLNEALSNHFERLMQQDRYSFGYRRDGEKARIRLRLNAENTRLKNDYISEDTLLDQRFFFVLPDIDLRFQLKNDWRIDLEYDTYIREPSLRQLQPFIDNTNPLRIYQGDPGLIPSYRHRYEFDLRKYNRETRKSINLSFDAEIENNPINTRQIVDEQLRQITSPVNVGRAFNVRSNISYTHPIKWLKSSISLSAGGTYRENFAFLNEINTRVEQRSTNFRLRMRNRDRKVISYYLSGSWNINQTTYVNNSNFDRQTINHRYWADIEYNVNQQLTLASTFSYRIYAGDAFNERQNLPIWGCEVVFFPKKDGQLELKLTGVDLLNRNQGFQRRVSSTFLEEQRINSLTRYFLLTANWKLSKMGVSAGRKKFKGN